MTDDKPLNRVRKRRRPLDLSPAVDETAAGVLNVTRTSYGREEVHTERIRVPDLAAVLKGVQPARVRIGGSVTRNLGDYNSARVEVMVELPCLPEASEIRRVAALCSSIVDEIIPTELDKSMLPTPETNQ